MNGSNAKIWDSTNVECRQDEAENSTCADSKLMVLQWTLQESKLFFGGLILFCLFFFFFFFILFATN